MSINTLEHEFQSSSDDTEKESQENTTKGNAANEGAVSTKTVVDNQLEDKKSIAELTGSFNSKTELRPLLANSVGSRKDDNHQSYAKKGGKKNKKKSKVVGIVESHEQCEKEKTSLEEESK